MKNETKKIGDIVTVISAHPAHMNWFGLVVNIDSKTAGVVIYVDVLARSIINLDSKKLGYHTFYVDNLEKVNI